MAGGILMSGVSGMAMAKSTIGGILFANAYWDDNDNGQSASSKFNLGVPNNSRLRVRWDNEDSVAMYFEMGMGQSKVSLRHAWGKWDINEQWQILAGQTSTPFAPLNPSVAMVHNSGQSMGNVSPGRQAQVRMTYKFLNRKGAVALAIVDPNGGNTLQDNINLDGEGNSTNLGDKNSKVPRFDLGAAFLAFNWQFFPSMFYQYQSYDDIDTVGSDKDLHSWGAALGAKTSYGPLVFSAEVGGGQNWGNSKMSLSGSAAGDNAGAVTYESNGVNKIADADNVGYWIDVGYRFTLGESQGVAHFIYGAQHSEQKAANNKYRSSMVGVSVPIDFPWIARGFRIRPEIFYFDHGNNTVAGVKQDSGTEFIIGTQLQYTF